MSHLSDWQVENIYEQMLESRDAHIEYCKENNQDFLDYVFEHFNDIEKEFALGLNPEARINAVENNEQLYQAFIWNVLSEEKLNILTHAFCNSNWRKFESWCADKSEKERYK